MKIDWNPNDSPIFRWLTAHAVAALALFASTPQLTSTLFGAAAPQVQTALGIASALGVLGVHYGAAQAKAVAQAVNGHAE